MLSTFPSSYFTSLSFVQPLFLSYHMPLTPLSKPSFLSRQKQRWRAALDGQLSWNWKQLHKTSKKQQIRSEKNDKTLILHQREEGQYKILWGWAHWNHNLECCRFNLDPSAVVLSASSTAAAGSTARDIMHHHSGWKKRSCMLSSSSSCSPRLSLNARHCRTCCHS